MRETSSTWHTLGRYSPPTGGDPSAERPEENPCQREGSIIECQNQILGEQIGIAGTPYQLRYISERIVDDAITMVPIGSQHWMQGHDSDAPHNDEAWLVNAFVGA